MNPTNLNFGKILKQVEMVDVNEDSLDLKFPKRTIVDISTDTFIKIIFEKDDNYYLFLNYVNALDLYLNYYTNINLVSSNKQLLNQDEHIDVYFKGGNVMNYHFRTMVSDPRLKELFSAYFKKSDFDFSVSIHTDTDNRFNQLKTYVYPKIIDYLITTSNLFNEYLQEIINGDINKSTIKIDPKFLHNFKQDNADLKYYTIRDTIKDIIGLPRFNFVKEIIDNTRNTNTKNFMHIRQIDNIGRYIRVKFHDNSIIQFIPSDKSFYELKYTPYIINNFNQVIDYYNEYVLNGLIPVYHNFYENSKYHACLLYPYYKYLVEPIGQHEMEYSDLIDKIIKYNFSLLEKSEFYTKEKINSMLQQISTSLNELKDTYYEKNSDNPPDKTEVTNSNAFIRYTVNKNRSDNPHIELAPTNNFLVYNDFEKSDPLSIINFDDNQTIKTTNNVHYVSGNMLIKNILGNRQILDFDLFRIKFNLVAVNYIFENEKLLREFKIPSEFIDVSVTIIDSNVYNEDHQTFIMPIKLDNTIIPDIPVKSHSYTYFIGDLIRILFTDFNFFPWMKGKYEKRIKRLLLLLYLYDQQHQTNYLDTLYNMATNIKYNLTNPNKTQKNMDKYALSKVHLNSYKDYSNLFDLVYIDNKYGPIKEPMKMLLIVSEILDKNNALDIINHFRKYLKLAPLTNISNLKTEFGKFLDEIINTYNDINPQNIKAKSSINTLVSRNNYSMIKNNRRNY
ncbi:hypothetical protein [Acanthamoeba polyphaga mimivirus]|nr:hypothetical protein [Acanthamoeba castellanii mamavirus]EJN40948.1 hypothetical protein lvs_L445 [Acanthamoeba polyphaga lentillevirus]UMZ07956.1 hypothetical protein [Acanthamoeba polyphaga mimivirus]